MEPMYADENGTSQVEIGAKVFRSMLSLCEQANDLETGGILVGRYSSDGTIAHVEEALGPPSGSRSTSTGFTRSCSGLSEVLRRKWTRRQYYLGEWHFHPQGRSGPSWQDRRQMAEIGSDAAYCCPTPILVVVGGSVGSWKMGVWVLTGRQLRRLAEVARSAATGEVQ